MITTTCPSCNALFQLPDDYAGRYYDALRLPATFESWATEAPFDTVMLQLGHKGSARLRDHLEHDAQWRLAYDDWNTVVFVRRPAQR